MDLPEVTRLEHHTLMALVPRARAAPYGVPSPLRALVAPGKCLEVLPGLLERWKVNLPHSFCCGYAESSLSNRGDFSGLCATQALLRQLLLAREAQG